MARARRCLTAVLTIIGLIAMVGLADAQGKGKEQKEAKGQQKETKGQQKETKGQQKEKAKGKQTHLSGKQLLGDKIKTNGKHVIDQKGKYTTSANVRDGKITGVTVKHSEKGDVKVTKYKTTRKMAYRAGGSSGLKLASYRGVLAQSQYMGTVYIGYAYTDEFGEETIYWFPYDMIYDGDTGAIEYIPAE